LTYDADTAIDLINRIRPAKIFRGDDGVPVEAIVGYETIKAWGGEIIVIPKRLPFSTTGSIAWKENL
jgi:bifunctional ADP-heptose synthase (sugar kinase/adenylyltransferase)